MFVFVFIGALTIIVMRRPDAILNPQFWAEDGAIFYADAYNGGLITLLSPLKSAGYVDIFPRLIAAFSQLFPVSWAPLLFNLTEISVRLLTVCLFLSSRFSEFVPDRRTRLFVSFLYLVLPNSWEVNASLAAIKFHFALLAFMVLSVRKADRPLHLFLDRIVILLSGLTGPFGILLTPIAAVFWIVRRERRSFELFMLLGVCTLIQCFFLLGRTRAQLTLGATPELFFRILSTQIVLGSLIGQKGISLLYHAGFYNLVAIVFGILGVAALINALCKAPLELRLFVLFAFLTFCAALSFPLVNKTDPQWPLLLLPGVGGRYWFISILAFVSVLVWSLRRSSAFISRLLAGFALVIMIGGIILDWRYPAFKDLNFRGHASRFESASVGTQVTIPINPPGVSMVLIKHL